MRKVYNEPEVMIEKFTLNDVLTTSTPKPGWEDGDEEIEF